MKAMVLWWCGVFCAVISWVPSAWAAPVQLVSVCDPSQTPAGGAGDSWNPLVTPDGRFVLFASAAENLAAGTNGRALRVSRAPRLNCYLRDRTNGTTVLVSMNLAGNGEGNGDSVPTSLSTNGLYACFESSASDLVVGDTNGVTDVFVRDIAHNTTLLISAATNGAVGDGLSRGSVMTPDGRYVAFVSAADTLVPDDTNGIADVFVRDVQTGTTILASVGALSTNALPLSSSESPEITPDGRYVAFYSSATNLVPGADSGGEIYVRDLVTGTTTWASSNSRSLLGTTNAISYNHIISDDGQFIAYEASTNAPLDSGAFEKWGLILRYNLATGQTDPVGTNAYAPPTPVHEIHNLDMTSNGRFVAFVGNANDTSGTTSGVYLWDAQTGTLALVSGDAGGNIPANSICDSPRLDRTGRFVGFLSSAPGLVTNSLIGGYHLYVRDLQAGTMALVDSDTNGIGSSSVSPSAIPRLSANARFVAFESFDANLVPNDRNRDYDVFVRDVAISTNELVSSRHPGLPSASPNGPSLMSSRCVSADGRLVAFSSDADNLVANDTNAFRDIFVRDLTLGVTMLVSAATNGAAGDGPSFEPVLSGNGRYVAFSSLADNLVAGDTNRSQDVFVRDLQTGTTRLVSVNRNGTGSGNLASSSPSIGADGRYVLFRSSATDLAPNQFSYENLFLRDTYLNRTYAITTSGVYAAAMTPDGRYIGFIKSQSPNVNILDTQSGATVYSISAPAGVQQVAISPDGNHIAYYSPGSGPQSPSGVYLGDRSANTHWLLGSWSFPPRPGLGFSANGRWFTYSVHINPTNQVYLYDFQTRTNILLSRNLSLGAVYGDSDSPDISADGRFVIFRSAAVDLVTTTDTNGVPDLFVYDRATGSNTLLTTSMYQPSSANSSSGGIAFSGDGRTVVLQSHASDLGLPDFSHSLNVFALTFLYASVSVGAQGPIVSWTARPGEGYRVEFKDNLTDPDWQQVVGSITTTGNQAQVTDLAPSTSQRFYRIVAF